MRDLNISPTEWDAFINGLRQTLDKFNVPSTEQAELEAIVNSTYGDIVVVNQAPNRAMQPTADRPYVPGFLFHERQL
jgi:hypothetical protein